MTERQPITYYLQQVKQELIINARHARQGMKDAYYLAAELLERKCADIEAAARIADEQPDAPDGGGQNQLGSGAEYD